MKIELSPLHFDEEQIIQQVGHNVSQRLRDRLDGIVAAAAQTEIQRAVAATVGDTVKALVLKPVQQTDRFGTPVGEATTIMEMMTVELQKYLDQKVDSNGRPDNGHYSTVTTRRQYLVREATQALYKEVYDKEVKAMLEQAKKNAAAMVAKAMEDFFMKRVGK